MYTKERFRIFDIPIDARSRKELEREIAGRLSGKSFCRISTANPEFLVRAYRDKPFHDTLLSADIRVADGTGIALAALLSGYRVSRYPGADLMSFILAEADKEDTAIFLATRMDGLSSFREVRDAIRNSFPKLRILGADLDPVSGALPEGIGDADVDLSNFGAPEQERFLESLRSEPGNIRIAMGVGGSFDFLTGKRRRAPGPLRCLGLEWLFRLVIQPDRIGRMWNAVAVFPFLWLSDRIKNGKQLTGDS